MTRRHEETASWAIYFEGEDMTKCVNLNDIFSNRELLMHQDFGLEPLMQFYNYSLVRLLLDLEGKEGNRDELMDALVNHMQYWTEHDWLENGMLSFRWYHQECRPDNTHGSSPTDAMEHFVNDKNAIWLKDKKNQSRLIQSLGIDLCVTCTDGQTENRTTPNSLDHPETHSTSHDSESDLFNFLRTALKKSNHPTLDELIYSFRWAHGRVDLLNQSQKSEIASLTGLSASTLSQLVSKHRRQQKYNAQRSLTAHQRRLLRSLLVDSNFEPLSMDKIQKIQEMTALSKSRIVKTLRYMTHKEVIRRLKESLGDIDPSSISAKKLSAQCDIPPSLMRRAFKTSGSSRTSPSTRSCVERMLQRLGDSQAPLTHQTIRSIQEVTNLSESQILHIHQQWQDPLRGVSLKNRMCIEQYILTHSISGSNTALQDERIRKLAQETNLSQRRIRDYVGRLFENTLAAEK